MELTGLGAPIVDFLELGLLRASSDLCGWQNRILLILTHIQSWRSSINQPEIASVRTRFGIKISPGFIRLLPSILPGISRDFFTMEGVRIIREQISGYPMMCKVGLAQ